MLIDRIFTPGLAQVAYLVADVDAGEVAVIDPRRDIGAVLDWADTHGFRIVAIMETHVHADFVSGAPELAAATSAPIYASRIGESEFRHVPLDDGDTIAVGNLRLQALWTPGHTPEHMSYLLRSGDDAEPTALFSGDLLFVGEVGRPDLLGDAHTKVLAGQLYDTIHDRLAALSDDVVVYPGHTAGSACGRNIGDAPHTTLGQERLTNYAFRQRSREEFVESVLAGMPPAPTYYPVLKKMNKAGAPLLTSLPAPASFTPDEIQARQAGGALLLDTREPGAFTAGHVPGSIFAGLGPNFTTWAGWLAPYDRPLILVLEHDRLLDEAVTELHRIGLDNVAGYLQGGITAWTEGGRAVSTIEQIDIDSLSARVDDPSLAILDVRSPEEYERGHIHGAVNVFAGKLLHGAPVPFPANQELAVICGTGYRSTVAVSELARKGYVKLANVPGGMTAWEDKGLPTTVDVTRTVNA